MFREAIMTVKNFNHRPSVSYFLKRSFPELLNADFYGKENFSRRNRKPNQKLKWSVKQVYL